MEMETGLVRRSNSLDLTSPQSLPTVIEKQLILTAQVFSKHLVPEEIEFWESSLSKQPAEAVAWAFTEYLKAGEFFPKPAEILERVREWHTRRRALEQQQEMDAARWTREHLRAEGQPAGEEQVAEIRKRLFEVAQKKGIPEHIERERAFAVRMKNVAAVIPPLDLTPEEIQARREREREEIRVYRNK